MPIFGRRSAQEAPERHTDINAHKAFTRRTYRRAMKRSNEPRPGTDKNLDGMPRGWGIMLALAVVLVALGAAAGLLR
jgi:hypothetical protein